MRQKKFFYECQVCKWVLCLRRGQDKVIKCWIISSTPELPDPGLEGLCPACLKHFPAPTHMNATPIGLSSRSCESSVLDQGTIWDMQGNGTGEPGPGNNDPNPMFSVMYDLHFTCHTTVQWPPAIWLINYPQNALDTRKNLRSPGLRDFTATRCAFIHTEMKLGGGGGWSAFHTILDCILYHQ